MTNPDNVGGLLSRVREALVSCTEYRVGSPAYEQIVAAIDRAELCRAPGDAGGLPERWRGLADKCEAEFPQKAQIFRWCANELCRAAPAGEFAGKRFTEVRIPQGYALDVAQAGVLAIVPQAAPAGGDEHSETCMSHHPLQTGAGYWGCDCGVDAREFGIAAPAGSGEVASLIERLESTAGAYPEDVFTALSAEDRALHGHVIQRAAAGMGRHMAPMLLEAAALLRKLSPAGSGEVVTDDMVTAALSAFSKTSAAHFAADRADPAGPSWASEAMRSAISAALLRKLQQGADYVMVPRVPTEAMLCAGRDANANAEREAHESSEGFKRFGLRKDRVAHTYRAMIAASQDQEGGK